MSPFPENDGVVFRKNDGKIKERGVSGFRFPTIA
jgi:hypothetical protein